MPIDPYAACPGGTGKKIKFCCPDLIGEIEQIDRLIDGDQGTAALEQVERLEEKHPRRACLMATRLKLQLATKKFAAAAATSREFLDAFPENPLAMGYAAVSDVIAGRIQEAAASFDRAREVSGTEIAPELLQVAATLVQAAAQAGHIGFAQGLVEWMIDKSVGTAEDRQLLAAVVGSSGVPPAVRTKMHLREAPLEASRKSEFDAALEHARAWRLAKALAAFRSLKSASPAGAAVDSPELFTNIGILCEMLARPFEASEAWLKIAGMPGASRDDAIEATGRAIALENEADEDRSPQIRFARLLAALTPTADAADGLDLLEDKLRHDGHFEQVPFDRSQWVSRGTVPPRSMWRVYDNRDAGGPPARLLATVSIFGRQTDREAEATLQGFAPDVTTARAIVEPLFGVTLAPASSGEAFPSTTPTNWLLGAQFRMRPPAAPVAEPSPGAPSVVDSLLDEQRHALWGRFLSLWPDTALPELLGKTPREALGETAGSRRVEALVTEGEATSRQRDAAEAWTTIRAALGMGKPSTIQLARPLEQVPPMRWHRVEMAGLDLEQLRALMFTAADAGFELAAEKAAQAVIARNDAKAEDRWEAYSLLEARATSSVERLDIIARLRELAKQLKVSDGMIDVAELRIRLQRGDQGDIMRLLDHLRREHSRDQKVLESLAEVLVEAGVDLSALTMQAQSPGGATIGQIGTPTKPEPTGIWTPGSPQSAQPAEKKTIWTPG